MYLVRVYVGELSSKFELWRPKDLTPGVERSTAGRFSFLPSFSRVSYAFRGSPAQTAALSVCREISVSRTQPSGLHPPVRKIGPELSDSLFSGASRVNKEFSFGVRKVQRKHSGFFERCNPCLRHVNNRKSKDLAMPDDISDPILAISFDDCTVAGSFV